MLEHTTITEYNKELVKTINELRNRIDYLERIEKLNFSTGTWASRPAAPLTNELLFATDYGQLNYFDGSNWNPVQYVSPNYVINGNFSVAQRGTSFVNPAPATITYTLDRWFAYWDGTGWAITVSQQAFTPWTLGASGGNPDDPAFYLRFAQTTAGSGTTSTSGIAQRIEDVRTLAGQTVTLSFWAKADTNRVVGCFLQQNFGTGSTSPIVNTTIQNNNLTTAWQKFNYTIQLGSTSGKNVVGNSFLAVIFQPPFNTANQTIEIAQVQLEYGPIATPFRSRTFAEELRLCLRYYEKSFGYGVVPADNAGGFSGGQATKVLPTAIAGTFYLQDVKYAVPKRAGAPLVTIYNPAATGNGFVHNFTRANAATANSLTANGSSGFTVQVTAFPAGWVASDVGAFHWTAESEI
jgi:hypothetical protein